MNILLTAVRRHIMAFMLLPVSLMIVTGRWQFGMLKIRMSATCSCWPHSNPRPWTTTRTRCKACCTATPCGKHMPLCSTS